VVAAVERVGAAQAERGAPLSADEVAEVVSHAPPLAAPHPDEFGAFLTDIASTLEEIVEAAPWRRKVAEAILRWEGEGIRTRRLEQALEADSAPDVDTLLAGFSDDVRRLQRIRDEMEEMGSDLARSPVLADPDRAAEAEALLVSARAARERRVEEAVRSAPQVDRWFFNAEKLAWSWLALDDRLLEELS